MVCVVEVVTVQAKLTPANHKSGLGNFVVWNYSCQVSPARTPQHSEYVEQQLADISSSQMESDSEFEYGDQVCTVSTTQLAAALCGALLTRISAVMPKPMCHDVHTAALLL